LGSAPPCGEGGREGEEREGEEHAGAMTGAQAAETERRRRRRAATWGSGRRRERGWRFFFAMTNGDRGFLWMGIKGDVASCCPREAISGDVAQPMNFG